MARPFMRIKLNFSKLDRTAFFKGKSGTLGDATIMVNDEPDQYGNHVFIVQDIGKERRNSGERGPIFGNGKFVDGAGPEAGRTAAPKPRPDDDDDDIFR